MDKIHHQHHKKAERMGVQLELKPEHGLCEAFWPAYNLRVYGADPRWALEQMQHAQKIIKEHDGESIHMEHDPLEPVKVKIALNGQWLTESRTPAMWATEELMDYLPGGEEYPGEVTDPHETSGPKSLAGDMSIAGVTLDQARVEFAEDKPRTMGGVPTSGREAHQKGFAIVDNPFPEGGDAAEEWEAEWEASAEEAVGGDGEEEAKPDKGTSVVKPKYRAIYAERGHPTHCGDELAVKLNNLVTNGKGTDIEYFKMIMDANEVDMSKYRTSGNGWQGRYRMTGRNKLAKKVHSAGGVFKLPSGETLQMSQEWMANQRFK